MQAKKAPSHLPVVQAIYLKQRGSVTCPEKRYTEEQIIGMLREAETILISKAGDSADGLVPKRPRRSGHISAQNTITFPAG